MFYRHNPNLHPPRARPSGPVDELAPDAALRPVLPAAEAQIVS